MRLKFLFFPLSLMLSLIMFIWMIKPEWDSLSKIKADYAQAQKDMQDVTAHINSIDEAMAQYSGLGPDKQLIQNAIPYDSQRDALFAQMYDKAKDSEVFITKVTMGQATSASTECESADTSSLSVDLAGVTPTPDGNDEGEATVVKNCLKSESVTVEVTGDYPKIKKFIANLEQMNRLAVVSKFSIDKEKQNEQPKEGEAVVAGLSAKIDFEVYYKSRLSKIDPMQFLNGLDEVSMQLISGQLDQTTIGSFKSLVAARPSAPVTVATTGKDDIFK